MPRNRKARLQRFPRWVFSMLVGLGAVVTILATVSLAHDIAYRRAAACAPAVRSRGCISHLDARVGKVATAGRGSTEITFDGSPAVPAAYVSLSDAAPMREGDSVTVEMWQGDVTAITTGERTVPTFATQSTSPLGIVAGVALLGFAAASHIVDRRFRRWFDAASTSPRTPGSGR